MAELRLAFPETSIATWGNGETRDVYTDETLEEFLAIDNVNAALTFSDSHPMLYGARAGRFRCMDSEDITTYSLVNTRENVALGVLYARELLEVSRRLYARGNAGKGCKQVEAFIEEPGRTEPESSTPQGFEFSYGAHGFQTIGVRMELCEYARYLHAIISRNDSAQYLPGVSSGAGWLYSVEPLPERESNLDPGVTDFFEAEARALRSGRITFLHEIERPGAISCADIADALCNLHLSDVKTVVYRGEENRLAASGVAALWWLAVDRMRRGRVFQCAACSKIDYETDKRGKPQRFCCPACKVWRFKHKAKDESGNYLEWLQPRRNL